MAYFLQVFQRRPVHLYIFDDLTQTLPCPVIRAFVSIYYVYNFSDSIYCIL